MPASPLPQPHSSSETVLETSPRESLLGPEEQPPFRLHRPGAASPVLLVCDHAGRLVPGRLGNLGVDPADWDRHIAWDIGAAGVCAALAPLLDATWIEQRYSRLVIDCNRRPGHPTSIATCSDGTPIPANLNLPAADARARVGAIFEPYHDAIAAELDRRRAAGRPTILIAMHSFTPVMAGVARPWQAGVLFNRSPALSLALAAELRLRGLDVGENEPYGLSDESDYTVPVHAEARGLAYLELEIRQDLIASGEGQRQWAETLAACLERPLAACVSDGAAGGD